MAKSTVLEFMSKPVLHVCSSESEIGQLVESSKKMSHAQNLVLLLNYSEDAVPRILPAFINAMIRLEDSMTRASSLQVEMLLLVSGTMNIGKALKKCGARSNSKFLVFASSSELFKKFSKTNEIRAIKRIELKLDSKVAGNVAITELLNA